jgi:hypothetical protein
VAKNGRQWLTVIHFKCVYCGQRITALEDGRGKKGTCPKCTHIIYVPQVFKSDSTISPLALKPPEISTPKQRPSGLDEGTPTIIPDLQTADPFEETTEIFEEKLGFLIPSYDELSLFLMAGVFIILYFTNNKLQDDITWYLTRLGTWRRGIYLVIFMLGMFLCLYHVFTKRQKTLAEKGIMLLFAVSINAATGFIAGFYMFKESPGWLFVFPAWNVINSILLIVMQYVNLFDEDRISDRDATITQVILGSAAILMVFYVCNNIFKLHWAITYSICIIYTTSFDRGLQSVFPLLAGQDEEQTPEDKP